MSRQQVSPEEMMNVAKNVAKGNDVDGGDMGGSASYGNNAQQDNYQDSTAQQGSYQSSGQQGSYSGDSNLPTGFDNLSEQQQGYEDVTGQQNGYNDSSGTDYTVDTPHADSSVSANANSAGNESNVSRSSARQGLQAQGEGFGQGFNTGFGQGLSGGPDGSQPHDGVDVQEDVGPGHASRDTDVHTTGATKGGGYETHQHHRDSFTTKSYVQGN